MSKKLNLAPVGVDSTAKESGTLEAQEAKANEKTTPSVLKNIFLTLYKILNNIYLCLINN
jgi:hypothetical protein